VNLTTLFTDLSGTIGICLPELLRGGRGHSIDCAQTIDPVYSKKLIEFRLSSGRPDLGCAVAWPAGASQREWHVRLGQKRTLPSIYLPIFGKSFKIVSRVTLHPLFLISSRALLICPSI